MARVVCSGTQFLSAEADATLINVKVMSYLYLIEQCHEEIEFIEQDILHMCSFHQNEIDQIKAIRESSSETLHSNRFAMS